MRKVLRSGLARFGLVMVIVAVSLVVASTAVGRPAQQQATLVAIKAGTPTEFQFTPARKTVLKGAGPLTVAFTVANKGTVRHDFKIAGKKTLPIAPGKARTLRVTFAKTGRYTFVCTLPGHALGGMKGTLIVKRP